MILATIKGKFYSNYYQKLFFRYELYSILAGITTLLYIIEEFHIKIEGSKIIVMSNNKQALSLNPNYLITIILIQKHKYH